MGPTCSMTGCWPLRPRRRSPFAFQIRTTLVCDTVMASASDRVVQRSAPAGFLSIVISGVRAAVAPAGSPLRSGVAGAGRDSRSTVGGSGRRTRSASAGRRYGRALLSRCPRLAARQPGADCAPRAWCRRSLARKGAIEDPAARARLLCPGRESSVETSRGRASRMADRNNARILVWSIDTAEGRIAVRDG